ncbi:MAG: hypothetical protein M1816_001697 [Peltula sp. TS41687]|nr:MAG: hypothetical protein M1816_001697 [Peltula sp. TS41687]
MSSIWNPETIKDVAESVGISSLNEDVVQGLSRDVEFRIFQVLAEATKFMRHGKRTILSTQDISHALRVLDVEPLYGYESTRPLRFGEASIGPGQPLFYVEDEEMDFEKLINAPLPKVPREISFTAHWLAVEGVQPSIPQNPTSAEQQSRNQGVAGSSSSTTKLSSLTGGAGGENNVNVKPLVKHTLSKELQLYFERVGGALLDESNEAIQAAALSSLRNDPGLHQLVPYFVQFISEKVTHHLRSIFVLTQMMHLTSALIDNESLYLDPYAASLIAPVLTCLIGRKLGDPTFDPNAHWLLRNHAASLLGLICKKHSDSSPTLKPRLVRTCLKQLLDPHKPLPVHYGALIGMTVVGGADTVRALILPNLKTYDEMILREHLVSGAGGGNNDATAAAAAAAAAEMTMTEDMDLEMVIAAILKALMLLEQEDRAMNLNVTNGHSGSGGELVRERLRAKIGNILGERTYRLGRYALAHAVLQDT